MSKVVTIHGHTLELDMGPSCPNPGIRRQLDKSCTHMMKWQNLIAGHSYVLDMEKM